MAQTLADRGIRVIIAGLDMDYSGKPFGPMPALMAVAEDVQKVHAICVKCGSIVTSRSAGTVSTKQQGSRTMPQTEAEDFGTGHFYFLG